MDEEEEAKEDLEKTEEKLEEIREQNIDPEDPETTKSIKQADSMVKNLRKDKKLTLKKLVKLKQIVGYMSKTLANNTEEEVKLFFTNNLKIWGKTQATFQRISLKLQGKNV